MRNISREGVRERETVNALTGGNTLPAGLTCLKEVAAASPRAAFSSLTSCQALRASHRLMKPGEPFTTEEPTNSEDHNTNLL